MSWILFKLACSLVTFGVSFVAILGYIKGNSKWYAFNDNTAMAPNTALALMSLSLFMVCDALRELGDKLFK